MKYSVGFVCCPVLARGLSPLSDPEAVAFLTSKYIILYFSTPFVAKNLN